MLVSQDRSRLLLGLALLMVPALAQAQYQLTTLVSNQFDEHPANTDPLLVNAWGLARSATSPWWVSDNLSGWSTLYNGAGTPQSLRVLIPTAGNGPVEPTGANGIGMPTGIVNNGASRLISWLRATAPRFIFATLDGTISAFWAGREQKPGNPQSGQLGQEGKLHRLGHHQ